MFVGGHNPPGREQGDAMMPLLCSLGQHRALQLVQDELREDEAPLAFLDDTYLVTSHERTTTVFATLQGASLTEAGIRLNPGKTKIWNSAGVKPSGCNVLHLVAATFDPIAVVWRGSELPTQQQGMKVLGTPLGQTFLWLLLVHCAAARGGRTRGDTRILRQERRCFVAVFVSDRADPNNATR